MQEVCATSTSAQFWGHAGGGTSAMTVTVQGRQEVCRCSYKWADFQGLVAGRGPVPSGVGMELAQEHHGGLAGGGVPRRAVAVAAQEPVRSAKTGSSAAFRQCAITDKSWARSWASRRD